MVYLDSIYPSPFLPDPPHPLSIHSNTCTVFLPSFAPLFPSSPLCVGWLSQSWSLVLECGQGTRCHAVEGNKLRLVQQQSNADSSSARGGSVPTSSSPRWDAVWLGFVDLGHAVGTVVRLYVHLVYCPVLEVICHCLDSWSFLSLFSMDPWALRERDVIQTCSLEQPKISRSLHVGQFWVSGEFWVIHWFMDIGICHLWLNSSSGIIIIGFPPGPMNSLASRFLTSLIMGGDMDSILWRQPSI